MARPPQDAIETFKAITGAPEEVAIFKLEEHRGDLNAAINAHFSEADRVNMQDQALSTAREDFMDIDDETAVDPEVQRYPLFPASRAANPFSPLDTVVPPHSFGTRSSRNNGAPRISHPRDVREIPIEVKDGSGQSSQLIPTVQDVTESIAEHGSTVQGNIFIDDEEDAVSLVPPPARNLRTNDDYAFRPAPSAPLINEVIDIDDDVEEQMIRAAIEASKKEASTSQGNKFKHADAIPLLTGDERTVYDTAVDSGQSKSSSLSGTRIGQIDHLHEANGRSKSEEGDDAEDSEEQPLMRRRSSRRHDLVTGNGLLVDRSNSEQHGDNQPQLNGDIFSDEWGGLSSEERHEAMMLEAMFGGVPESSAYPFAQPLQSLSERQAAFHARVARSPSPNLVAQRILREQQDDEYLASLAADREKEVKAIQEAELHRSEEEAAQKAALEQEMHKKEAAERKLREEEEYEIQLSVKLASLPREPAADDENAVTLLVRLPDGCRQERRFLKSDTLGALFNFIDVGKVVKPNTYRLVRPYPRCSFGEADKERSLRELGLTSKQEALFLEFI